MSAPHLCVAMKRRKLLESAHRRVARAIPQPSDFNARVDDIRGMFSFLPFCLMKLICLMGDIHSEDTYVAMVRTAVVLLGCEGVCLCCNVISTSAGIGRPCQCLVHFRASGRLNL